MKYNFKNYEPLKGILSELKPGDIFSTKEDWYECRMEDDFHPDVFMITACEFPDKLICTINMSDGSIVHFIDCEVIPLDGILSLTRRVGY